MCTCALSLCSETADKMKALDEHLNELSSHVCMTLCFYVIHSVAAQAAQLLLLSHSTLHFYSCLRLINSLTH